MELRDDAGHYLVREPPVGAEVTCELTRTRGSTQRPSLYPDTPEFSQRDPGARYGRQYEPEPNATAAAMCRSGHRETQMAAALERRCIGIRFGCEEALY